MTRATDVVCLECGCPAAIGDGTRDWRCPNCGCGFVKVEATRA